MKTQHIDEKLLNEYISNSGLRIDYICTQLGLSTTAFHNKRKGKTPFRVSEIYVLCDLLHINNDDKTKIFYAES